MKKLIQLFLITVLCVHFNCDLKNSKDEDSSTTNPPSTTEPVYEDNLESIWFTIDGKDYDTTVDTGDYRSKRIDEFTCGIKIPYLHPFTNLVAQFKVSEGAKVYINGVEQVSGVTVNDFTNPLPYRIVSKDGKKEHISTLTVSWLPNKESKLYWLKVTAGGTPYDCVINQESKTVTLTVPTGTSLSTVTLDFKISDYALFYQNDGWRANGVTTNFSDTSIIIKIKAENTSYYTEYTLVKVFTDK